MSRVSQSASTRVVFYEWCNDKVPLPLGPCNTWTEEAQDGSTGLFLFFFLFFFRLICTCFLLEAFKILACFSSETWQWIKRIFGFPYFMPPLQEAGCRSKTRFKSSKKKKKNQADWKKKKIAFTKKWRPVGNLHCLFPWREGIVI